MKDQTLPKDDSPSVGTGAMRRDTVAASQKKHGFPKVGLVLSGCAACAALFLAIRLGAGWLANPIFCPGCHVMQTQYVSYLRSTHHHATCVDCHSGNRCTSCHTAWSADAGSLVKVVNSPDQALHEIHRPSRNVACAACHRGIMHARTDGYAPTSARSSCQECHSQTELGFNDNRFFMRNPPHPEGL